MTKKNLYLLILGLGICGYTWLYFNHTLTTPNETSWCITKNITGYPCPACGSTRSALSIIEGNLHQAILLNPLGYLVLLLLIVLPIWVLIDLLIAKKSFYTFYVKAEAIMRNNYFIMLAGIALLLNWIWNITKGL